MRPATYGEARADVVALLIGLATVLLFGIAGTRSPATTPLGYVYDGESAASSAADPSPDHLTVELIVVRQLPGRWSTRHGYDYRSHLAQTNTSPATGFLAPQTACGVRLRPGCRLSRSSGHVAG